jgi:hypothetical protein
MKRESVTLTLSCPCREGRSFDNKIRAAKKRRRKFDAE